VGFSAAVFDEPETLVENNCAVFVEDLQADGDFSIDGALEDGGQELGADAPLLPMGMDDNFHKEQAIAGVLDGGVAAWLAVGEKDFKGAGFPFGIEELVLAIFVPGAELGDDDIVVGLVMGGAAEFLVVEIRRAS
jgi:hypothetical protein